MDYGAFNWDTIQARYPIPVIDELMDKLYGPKVLSKLDLKSGYHQFGICIFEMAFDSCCHYEFLVMSFRLANIPATFQSLMNQLFHPHHNKEAPGI